MSKTHNVRAKQNNHAPNVQHACTNSAYSRYALLKSLLVVQCRLQLGNSNSNHQYSGPRQCLQHLLRTEGPRGLTRGMQATIAREAPGNAIFFTVYEVNTSYV